MAETGTTAKPDSDEAILHRLGYAQVLYREMGGFSNFAISFTIISILAGCLTSYYLAWNYGGPIAVTWGWLLVGVFCVLVAMAMGEIASAMPTAGALYFWASKLGGPAWGWFTGWFNLVGQIAVTAAIDYGAALFTTALLNLLFPTLVSPASDYPTVFATFTVIVILHIALNLANVNLLAKLNTISAWWHMIGVAIIVVILFAVPDSHQSAGFVFGEWINNSGFADGAVIYIFGLGLLMAQYTVTGYDASAHMSEETRQASRTAAIGMVMAVVASVVFGFILLVAVTFAVQDVDAVSAAGGLAPIVIFTGALGEDVTKLVLLIVCVAQFFCGTASLTSASRMLFAFSRDRAVPFSGIWRKVAVNRVPVNAVIVIAVIAWALMLPTLLNGVVGYAVGTSIAVIGLYIAFGLPILLRIKAGDKFQKGAWTLGNHYKWISTISVVWIGIICILFLLPISPKGIPGAEDFSWESVNYAPITVLGALILFGGWFFLSAKHWFKGPVREFETEEQLEAIEHLETVPAAPKTEVAAVAVGATTTAAVTAPLAATEAPAEDATVEVTKVDDATAEDATAEDATVVETPAEDAITEVKADEDATAVVDTSADDTAVVDAEPEAAEAPTTEDATTEDATPETVSEDKAEDKADEKADAEPVADAVAEPAAEPVVAEPVVAADEPAEEPAKDAEAPAEEPEVKPESNGKAPGGDTAKVDTDAK
ncbi:amino acid permease [Pseudonocardia sp. TRM90224]|uniref:amino acid permease n=1 Tax=Pseudonocardia sp. TRM90224 TaxID=2812678 RepID=UPI001E5FB85D|nr:amino acid permease [Pseudonocardia sp. TRM90224]